MVVVVYKVFNRPEICKLNSNTLTMRLFLLYVTYIIAFTGSAITGPVAKECADLWPRIASNAGSIH